MRYDNHTGAKLEPGVNLDELSIADGLMRAVKIGYESWQDQMVVEYALMRHARGEEDGAQRSALSGGIDFTSWRMILAAARTRGAGNDVQS